MRTSEQQFELMVTFMEQHGDLSKLPSESCSRIQHIKNWEKLTCVLNSDGSGDTKTTEKWRKVWSDLKNNTKKKAARLKAASRTGGVVHSNLRDLEQRVLNLVKKEAATGLAVNEDVHIEPSAVSADAHSPSPVTVVKLEQSSEPCNQPESSCWPNEISVMRPPQSHSTSPPYIHVDDEIIEGNEELNDPLVLATQPHVAVPEAEVRPACSGQTKPNHNRQNTRTRASLRRPVRSSRIDNAARQFLQSNTEWREFRIQQHKDYMDMRREQNRIREMEVLAQREWQTIGLRVLDLLDKLVTKYCRN